MRIVAVLLLALAMVAASSFSRIGLEGPAGSEAEEKELLYLPNGRYLKLVSLGQASLVADVVYLWAIQFYSDYGREDRYTYLQHIFGEVIPELVVEGMLLTMADRRNNLAKQVEEEVRNHFGERVFRTVIPRNVRLSEAPSHGKPILLYDAHSKGAISYLQLADEILQRLAPPPPSAAPPSLTTSGESA